MYNVIDQETFERFIKDVENQIKEADQISKQKAEDTLKAVAENYRQKVADRIAAELVAADECLKVGDDIGARHHKVLADIYRSLFNIHATTKS